MTSSHNEQVAQIPMSETPKPKRVGWLVYFGIAIIIAFWTALGALFFLLVVWVLRRNPGSDVSFMFGRNDQKVARRVYTWLFLSSFTTVPIFLIAASNTYNSTNNERVLAALFPLIVHLPLLLGLTSKSGFVYRHTQQGILLIALRAGFACLAAMTVNDNLGIAILLFIFGNGGLWLIGSIVGWSQTASGKCWFMDRKGEKIILAEAIQPEQPNESIKDKQLDNPPKFHNTKDADIAKQNALHAFRTGMPAVRKRAVEILSEIGEVEKF
jgi:hypothetical protein